MRTYTYAATGRAIMNQPQGVAFQFFDRKCEDLLGDYQRASGGWAKSLPELANMLGVDSESLVRTIEEYNATVQQGDFNPMRRDGKATLDLAIPKSNWANPLDTPPFEAYAVTCGVTFTFGGLKIVPDAGAVLDTTETPIPGLYAAGELVGGLFYFNYPGGSGLVSGSVFGRIAGRSAGRAALGKAG